MTFVTDEMVIASMRARCQAECGEASCAAGCIAEDFFDDPHEVALERAGLEAASVLWLAHVRAASEHTTDYQMAAAAAEIEKGLTT